MAEEVSRMKVGDLVKQVSWDGLGVVIYFGQCWSVELANMRMKKGGDLRYECVQN